VAVIGRQQSIAKPRPYHQVLGLLKSLLDSIQKTILGRAKEALPVALPVLWLWMNKPQTTVIKGGFQ